VILSQPLKGAIQSSHQNASGQLYHCSILAGDPNTSCRGAEGKMCLIYFDNQKGFSWHVSDTAEESGCIGVIAFIKGFNGPVNFDNADTPLLIPFVYIENGEGQKLIQNKITSNATLQVDVFGVGCYATSSRISRDICRGDWHCKDGDFCVYYDRLVGPDMYNEGYCWSCPTDANGDPNPLACYFNEDLFRITLEYDSVQNVESCALSCGAEAVLESRSCKFCPSDLTKFQFGIESEKERCIFCPQSDLQFPDRTISLFGENITCYQMETFFQRLPVPKDSSNCQLAQSMNYICGCGGIGYAGAKTNTKQVILAWLPRVAAILSLLVSCFITDMIHRLSLRSFS
jgi:hypothetical protein